MYSIFDLSMITLITLPTIREHTYSVYTSYDTLQYGEQMWDFV